MVGLQEVSYVIHSQLQEVLHQGLDKPELLAKPLGPTLLPLSLFSTNLLLFPFLVLFLLFLFTIVGDNTCA